MKKAFTMLELIFVIVVIGILASIAIPKLSVTRDDAIITKAKNVVASVRSALSNEIQRRIMQGNFTPVNSLGGSSGYDAILFDYFDGDNKNPRILEYPIRSCKNSSSKGCWIKSGNNEYIFYMPPSVGGSVKFKVINNRFECDYNHNANGCKMLER